MGTLVLVGQTVTMKVVLAVLVLVAVAYAAPEKRFIESVGHFFHNVGHSLSDAFNSAKDQFNKISHGLDFHKAVDLLIPYIDSDMTEGQCDSACKAAASSVLGAAAPLASTLCPDVCKGALSKLEQAAGK